MADLVPIVIALAYLSLIIELLFLPVPSVASSRAIWQAEQAVAEGYSSAYQRLFRLPKWQKLLILFVPLLGVYGLFLMPVLVLFGVGVITSVTFFEPSALTNAVGLAAILLGRYVTLRSVILIRQQHEQQQDPFDLQTGGLFGLSRNPIQVGMYLFFLGIFICMPSVLIFIGWLYYMAYMHVKIKMEENFLRNKFGQRYLDYLARTGRYL